MSALCFPPICTCSEHLPTCTLDVTESEELPTNQPGVKQFWLFTVKTETHVGTEQMEIVLVLQLI